MADTSNRPRVGAMQVMRERPSSMFYDSWAVCPFLGCTFNERDGTAHYSFASNRYSCDNGHVWDERYGLWEVQGR